MDNQTLEMLNRIFADVRGLNEYAQPYYRWSHTSDLKFPLRSDSDWVERGGIIVPQAKYEWVPQIDEERWCVAQWRRDDLRAWEISFGSEVPWPDHGLYYVTNLMLKEGEEPTESMTHYFASCIVRQSTMNWRDFHNALLANQEEKKARTASMIDAWVTNAIPAFANGEPGKRGNHVSFGGI